MSLYLVTGEYLDPGPLMPPQQAVPMIKQVVLPSLEEIAKLIDQKKILAGGIHVGAKKGTFIVEAASNAEVDKLLIGLPFWPLLKWTVEPLLSFRERAAEESKLIETMSARMQ